MYMSIMEHHLITDNSVLKHYVLPLITETAGQRIGPDTVPFCLSWFVSLSQSKSEEKAEHVDTAVKNF